MLTGIFTYMTDWEAIDRLLECEYCRPTGVAKASVDEAGNRDLRGDLRAADLQAAHLVGANLNDAHAVATTVWLKGFQPCQAVEIIDA